VEKLDTASSDAAFLDHPAKWFCLVALRFDEKGRMAICNNDS